MSEGTPREGARPNELQAVVVAIAGVLDRADRIDLQVPHDTGLLTLDPKNVEHVRALLADATSLLRRVLTLSERDDVAAFAAAADESSTDPELSWSQLADVAFVGRLELEQIGESLQAAAAQKQVWRVVSDADRAVARTVRSLAPIEGALRKRLGQEPVERRWFDLDDALESRARYAGFYLQGARVGDPDPEAIGSLLQDLAQRIEALRRDEIYPYLRVDDRLGFRTLQKRIVEHLASDAPSPATGIRLWQDANGFFGLLMQISRREELLNHDLHLAARLSGELDDEGAMPNELPGAFRERMLHFAGRDEELDALLVRDQPGRTSEYRAPLGRVRDRLLRR